MDAAATAKLERAQALEREVAESTDRLQKVVDQLNQAVRSTIEKFDGHVTAQLNSWSAQFKNHVDGISREKAAQFTSGLEQQLSSQLGEANEVLEKLSAGLQLARGTVRVQESQWAERSRELAGELEKEIKSVLIRLADKM
jgi:DNA anti-recombination protein RmuC